MSEDTGRFAIPERDQALEDVGRAPCVECGHAGGGRYCLWAAERWRLLGPSCGECGARIPRGLVAALSDPKVRTARALGRRVTPSQVPTHQLALVTSDPRFPGRMVLLRGSLEQCQAEAAHFSPTPTSTPVVEPADGRELGWEVLARLRARVIAGADSDELVAERVFCGEGAGADGSPFGSANEG